MSTANRTADPYEIGVAYIDGDPLRPFGEVTSEPVVVFDHPDPDRLRPYIEAFLREEAVLQGRLTEGPRHRRELSATCPRVGP